VGLLLGITYRHQVIAQGTTAKLHKENWSAQCFRGALEIELTYRS
jgi:hypothetical protein